MCNLLLGLICKNIVISCSDNNLLTASEAPVMVWADDIFIYGIIGRHTLYNYVRMSWIFLFNKPNMSHNFLQANK